MSHRLHPDVHEEGLQDNCEACHEHALNPFSSLDADILSYLVILTIEMREGKDRQPRTRNERIARANVMNALEHAGKIMEVTNLTGNLDIVKGYYNRYWRIPIS